MCALKPLKTWSIILIFKTGNNEKYQKTNKEASLSGFHQFLYYGNPFGQRNNLY